jgi:hypothetical protein
MLLLALLLEAPSTARAPSLKIIAGIALLSLFFWKIVASAGNGILPSIRKLFLIIFYICIFFPYRRIALALKKYLILNCDLNYFFTQIFREFKGSDWADGILSATFFYFYCLIVLYLWKLNSKHDKPKSEEKPVTIEFKVR